ncbi:ABC transporter ATP-binding protein [Streptomyces sp. ST2-7A]|uniref:ABC transporter ATP-binding protein n=1 Tax=Streptomyces sp. ST2-7A TaxID=2907214 RepID=UPI001F220E52|nr:ABC transporter ATP-binding protein [Streptomyces sp. ST2-7A]MCE7080995.1 ABC transporter ATP-binding protein [Streptomyces sp. ST2-7A]
MTRTAPDPVPGRAAGTTPTGPPARAADPAVTVTGLRVVHPGATDPAVEDVSFTVGPGEVLGLLGPSGAGKSTIQAVLARLVRPRAGTVTVLGTPLEKWGHDYFDRVGVAFELPAARLRLTARRNLSAFAALHRVPTADPVELLARVDLADRADHRVGTFSKGMRMRLELARALINRPRLLLLDEPTSGQDPVRAARLREVIRAEADRGAAVVMTTHDMDTADRLCDRLAFVSGGRIAAIDTPRGFRLRHGRPGVVVEYREPGEGDDSRRVRRVLDTAAPRTAEELAGLLRAGVVETLHTREAGLDEVFAALTGDRL